MPILPISDGTGSLLPLAGERVYAAMLFPGDEARRERILTLAMAEDAVYGGTDPALISREFLVKLLDLPSREHLGAEIEQLSVQALFATRILQYIISLHHHASRHASVRKGAALAVHFGNRNPGLVAATSRAHVLKHWGQFRPVAHLWCALFNVKSEEPLFQLFGLQEAPLLQFLGTAEWFRRQGESIVARRAEKHGPVLDPAETWVPPVDLSLPEVELEPGAPTEETLAALRAYRAPKA